MQDQGRVANPRPVARIKTGRFAQPITDAADATGLEFAAREICRYRASNVANLL